MKKIIIVGAGIAGLAAGIYGQKAGFETEIYEKHTIPGGECTGWDQGEYHFDGCIHWMMGTKPGTPLNNVWNEVGALGESVRVVNHDFFCRFEENGNAVNIYREIDRLERHLSVISPEDQDLIREMCEAVKALAKMEMPVDQPLDMYSEVELERMNSRMEPLLPYLAKYGAITVQEFTERFKHPSLRRAIQTVIPTQYSAITLLTTLSAMNTEDSGWPMGGSRKLAARMEEKYRSLGGKVYYHSPIAKIKIEGAAATGVILEDGSERRGDYIISAADGYFTLCHMLQGKYRDETMDALYSEHEAYPVYTTVQVSVGVACDLSAEPHMLYFTPTRTIDAGGIIHSRVGLRHYCYDPSMAPRGKSVITVLMDADYDWWQEKYREKNAYTVEKERVAQEVRNAIEEKYPATKGKIERLNVATPMTYVRYCNAWRGAWMSWMTTPSGTVKYLPGTVEGLERFYLTGQWTMPPGGLPGAVLTGKWTIQRICNE